MLKPRDEGEVANLEDNVDVEEWVRSIAIRSFICAKPSKYIDIYIVQIHGESMKILFDKIETLYTCIQKELSIDDGKDNALGV